MKMKMCVESSGYIIIICTHLSEMKQASVVSQKVKLKVCGLFVSATRHSNEEPGVRVGGGGAVDGEREKNEDLLKVAKMSLKLLTG